MNDSQGGCRTLEALFRGGAGRWRSPLASAAGAMLAAVTPIATHAQQVASASPLVFDSVTVVDVEQGKLVPGQRVVIAGNRIQAVGAVGAVAMPKGAQVVDARSKYLIPGLWDMHTHSLLNGGSLSNYIRNGVTGTRDAGVLPSTPLDGGFKARQDILAGTRVGPRMVVPGPVIQGDISSIIEGPMDDLVNLGLLHDDERKLFAAISDEAAARDSSDAFAIAKKRPDEVVRALKAAGADFIKVREVSAAMYFAFAAAARRAGIPFSGHVQEVSPIAASDSGATMIDHPTGGTRSGGMYTFCLARNTSATVETCREVADHFRRNGTWWVPTLGVYMPQTEGHFAELFKDLHRCDYSAETQPIRCAADTVGMLSLARRAGIPIVAGTDNSEGGAKLHDELGVYVAEGLTPLEALQSATLNPAKALRATDSLGTVAAGKLADLVLLDADPLADITQTKKIRAVVANGRYFDRATLDQLTDNP